MILESHRPPSFQDSLLVTARISGSGGKQEVQFRYAAQLYQGVGDDQGHAFLPPLGPGSFIQVNRGA